MRKQQYNVNKIPQTTRFRDFISRMSQYDIGDPEEWIQANPQKRIFIVFEANKLAFRVMTRKETDLEYLVKDFREDDQSMYFMQRYSGNALDPYRYSVSPFGYFQPGLLTSVLKALQGNVMINPMGRPVLEFTCLSDGVKRYMIEWLSPLMRQVKQLQSKLGDDLQVSNISVDRMPEDKVLVMRDYQEKAIEAVLTTGFGRGMIESATGSGKSFIIANLIYTLWSLGLPKPNARTLIYVPNIQLVEQFYSDLLSYGYKEDEVCKCSGALKTADKRKMAQCSRTAPIVIANSAWCNNHIQEVGDIDILLIDEVHRCTPDSVGFTNLREQLCECKVRVGFSGTIPQDCYNRWELEGLLGPVIYRASVTSLQDQGYLSQLRIVKVKLTDKRVVDDDNLLFSPHSKWRQNDYSAEYGGLITATDAWIAEQDWYSTHCARIFAPVLNNLILADPNTKLTNTLILFDRLALGESLFNHLDTNVEADQLQGLKVLYIDGQTEVQERERIRASLESSNGNILLGQSSILSTGINIKNLGRIVLLCGGKAQARIIQSIGRTLRLSANKDHAELVDVELSYKYSHRHALERKHLYKEWYNKDKFDETYEFDV